jgi:hypothetical protein
VTFWYGSGSGSGSGYWYFHQWPSRQKICFFCLLLLKVHLHHSSRIRSRKEVTKKSQNSRNKGFLFIFAWCKDPDPSGPKTSGSGTLRPVLCYQYITWVSPLLSTYLRVSIVMSVKVDIAANICDIFSAEAPTVRSLAWGTRPNPWVTIRTPSTGQTASR